MAKKQQDVEKFYLDPEFLNSPTARPLRLLAEYFGPQKKLWEAKVEDTIVFFGSARAVPMQQAKKELREYQDAARKKPSAVVTQKIKVAQRRVMLSRYYEDAVALAEKLTRWSKSLNQDKQKYLICSGGGPGMMEAANRGAYRAAGQSVGLNISLPEEPNANRYISKHLNFEFHYFFMRKYWFAYMAKALVIFPGGFGTLDELAEIATLVQTRKMQKPIPIVIYGRDYWNQVLNMQAMVDWGTISAKDLQLFHVSDDVDEAYDFLVSEISSKFGTR